MIQINLTEGQIRSELGKVKLFRVEEFTRFGVNYKFIIAKDYKDAERKAKEVFRMVNGKLKIRSENEFINF